MSFIEFKHIGKKYAGADKNSVSDFNLEINEKEFIAFVGPSGCGKSTTLRMVAGFEEITEGDLYIDGKKVNETAPRDRGIAMVFQNYALYPHMTVEKNIGYGLKNMKMPADQIKKKVDWAICLFDFFSGGVFIYKNMEVTVYIFIALFLLGIVRKRDTPSVCYGKYRWGQTYR